MQLKQQVTSASVRGQCGGGLQKIHRVSTFLLLGIYAIFLSGSPVSLAQQSDSEARGPLTLFAAIDADENARNTNNRRELPGAGGADEAPEFSLMGSSRIGARRSVLLLHKSGTPISLPLTRGKGTPIPNHESYTLLSSPEGEVVVQYPNSRPCRASETHGVSCETGNRAILALAAADPLPPRATEESVEGVNDDAERVTEPPLNPFEALRQRAANGQANAVVSPEDQRRFRPRRINPDQVPDGMRVVSTPFGDRLVDI
jgi:hypothetical protein